MKTIHPNATSLKSAAIAKDYPYGRLKTSMHFFVEHNGKKGWRPVTQSINPKNGRLNNPHAGVYSSFPIYVVEVKPGFFEFLHVPNLAYYPDKFKEFVTEYWSQIPEEDKISLKSDYEIYSSYYKRENREHIVINFPQ